MLTRENDIDVHVLHRQGWTISAIARHLGRDRKTIRAYLAGREAGVRVGGVVDPFERFAGYCGQRLADDPHLWASTLFDELLELGYDRSYPTMTRQLRGRALRPPCEACRPVKGRAVAVIDHPAGQETQWDWVELPDPPAQWGWGKTAHLLVGALSHSGRWRAVFAESEDQAHLIDALDRVAHALGGLTFDWRFDRDGHCRVSRHGPGERVVRCGGQALRGDGQALPATAREPQRRGREGESRCGATVLAHPGR